MDAGSKRLEEYQVRRSWPTGGALVVSDHWLYEARYDGSAIVRRSLADGAELGTGGSG